MTTLLVALIILTSTLALAYRSTSLILWTAAATAGLGILHVLGDGLSIVTWAVFLSIAAILNIKPQRPAAELVQKGPAADVGDREGSHRRRHRVVGCRTVHRPARLAQAAQHSCARAQRRRKGVFGRAGGDTMPDAG